MINTLPTVDKSDTNRETQYMVQADWLVGWLFFRINVDLAIVQLYLDWKQEITNL